MSIVAVGVLAFCVCVCVTGRLCQRLSSCLSVHGFVCLWRTLSEYLSVCQWYVFGVAVCLSVVVMCVCVWRTLPE